MSGESRWSKGEEGKASMAAVMRVKAEESLRVERVLVRVCLIGRGLDRMVEVKEVEGGRVDAEGELLWVVVGLRLAFVARLWLRYCPGMEMALSIRWRVVRGVMHKGAGLSF